MIRAPDLRSRMRALALSTPVLALVVLLVTWTRGAVTPAAGLDPSWQVALQMATHEGLDWGTQFIWTYGPLGFLSHPLTMYGGLTAFSAVYMVAVLGGFAAAVLWALRRHGRSTALAVAVALVASTIVRLEVLVPLVFVVCAVVLSEERPTPRLVAMITYGGGFVAGVGLLVKLNTGVTLLAIVAVTLLSLPERRLRAALQYAGTVAVTFTFFWFLTGQGVGNFAAYVHSSVEIVAGYTSAMGVNQASLRWTIPVALVLMAGVLTLSVLVTRSSPRRVRVAMFAVVAIVAFSGWKEGFVRHDTGHLALFFVAMLGLWIGMMAAAKERWTLVLGLAGYALTVLLYTHALSFSLTDRLVHPIQNTKDAVAEVKELVDPASRARDRDGASILDAAGYRVDPRTLALIGRQPVDIYPSDASIAWVYGLNWRPEPVPQSYSAYTTYLDERNAGALSSPTGPAMILRRSNGIATTDPAELSIDSRLLPYDDPAATLAMLCNFRTIRTKGAYQLLKRIPDRCGPSQTLGSTTAGYGEPIPVPKPPRPNEFVIAHVEGAQPTGIERAKSLLYKPAPRYVSIDDSGPYTLVTGTAADGLLASAPRSLDFPGKFAMSPQAGTFTFTKESAFASPGDELHVEFDAIPVRAR